MEGKTVLINYLDRPMRILIWNASTVLIVATGFLGAIVFDSWLSLFLPFLFLGLKKKFQSMFPSPLKHLLYWNFPPLAQKNLLGLKDIPPSHCRELFLYGPARIKRKK